MASLNKMLQNTQEQNPLLWIPALRYSGSSELCPFNELSIVWEEKGHFLDPWVILFHTVMSAILDARSTSKNLTMTSVSPLSFMLQWTDEEREVWSGHSTGPTDSSGPGRSLLVLGGSYLCY